VHLRVVRSTALIPQVGGQSASSFMHLDMEVNLRGSVDSWRIQSAIAEVFTPAYRSAVAVESRVARVTIPGARHY
jgi:hypothetical protein